MAVEMTVRRWQGILAALLVVVLLAGLLPTHVRAEVPQTAMTAVSFTDVPAGHVFEREIAWLASTGITQGRGDGTFGLSDPVSRGAMAAFLYRFDGAPEGPFDAPEFADVPEGHTFEEEIAWLASTGITQGRDDGSFGLSDDVTRGAMAAFLYRYAGEPEFDFEPPVAPDPEPDPDPEPAPGAFDAQRWIRGISSDPDDEDPVRIDRGAMNDVTVGGAGLVAVGSSFDEGVAVAWTSTDGLEWDRALVEPTSFTAVTPGMSAVTVGGPGLVAVGDANGIGLVWTSVDGRTWEPVPQDPAVFGDPSQEDFERQLIVLMSVTSGGPGLVAVGSVDGTAAVWTSSDGAAWERVPGDPEVFGEELARMNRVIEGGPGLVAVGQVTGEPAVWASVDGLSWQRVADDGTAFGSDGFGSITDVAVGGPGLIAVGSAGGPAAWTSTDGTEWSRVAGESTFMSEQEGRDVVLDAVSSGGPGLVVFGREFVQEFAFAGMVVAWTSADGAQWDRVPYEDDVFSGEGYIVSVIEGGPGLVAVGADFGFSAVLLSGPDLEG